MSKNRLGEKPLRLLVLLAVIACVLCGCGESKYEPLDSSIESETQSGSNEPMAFTIGESVLTDSEQGQPADSEDTAAESESISYEAVHDWVVVTADALNVRASDNTSARIYVQLHAGDLLERVGYHEKWSQVVYDGDVAYVATDMVEIAEEVPSAITSNSEAQDVQEAQEAQDVQEAQITQEAQIAQAAQAAQEAAIVLSQEDGVPVYEKTGTSHEEVADIPSNGHVIAIDAGHQAKANAEKEPIGPGSSTMKAKMPEGAVGAATGVKEYELTLTVSQKLKSELEARGYKIVMIRTGHDVNLSNAERSKIANESDAEIFIRLHANSMENSGIYGALAMCMTEYNPYNSELYQDSYSLSKKIINNICELTGTKNRGVQKVDNSSAINWSEIPVSVVEMGFLTNPDEDKWLQNEEYQGKIVNGIANAVDSYFSMEN